VGAKGIKVCHRWRSNFDNFIADVGRCPKGKRFLQRIDHNRDFRPGNVRWADEWELGCHHKNNRWITLDNITLHLMEWSRVTGIKHVTLWKRIQLGWSHVEVLTTSVGQPRGNYQPRWRQDQGKLVELAKRNFQNSKAVTQQRRKTPKHLHLIGQGPPARKQNVETTVAVQLEYGGRWIPGKLMLGADGSLVVIVAGETQERGPGAVLYIRSDAATDEVLLDAAVEAGFNVIWG
jgi:hypothetical protein